MIVNRTLNIEIPVPGCYHVYPSPACPALPRTALSPAFPREATDFVPTNRIAALSFRWVCQNGVWPYLVQYQLGAKPAGIECVYVLFNMAEDRHSAGAQASQINRRDLHT